MKEIPNYDTSLEGLLAQKKYNKKTTSCGFTCRFAGELINSGKEEFSAEQQALEFYVTYTGHIAGIEDAMVLSINTIHPY